MKTRKIGASEGRARAVYRSRYVRGLFKIRRGITAGRAEMLVPRNRAYPTSVLVLSYGARTAGRPPHGPGSRRGAATPARGNIRRATHCPPLNRRRAPGGEEARVHTGTAERARSTGGKKKKRLRSAAADGKRAADLSIVSSIRTCVHTSIRIYIYKRTPRRQRSQCVPRRSARDIYAARPARRTFARMHTFAGAVRV